MWQEAVWLNRELPAELRWKKEWQGWFGLPSKSIIFFIDYLMVVKKKAEQDSCRRSHNERTRGKR